MTSIEAVIYDYGGVFSGSPFGAISAYETKIGAEPGAVSEVLFGRSYAHGAGDDHPWHLLETGKIEMSVWTDYVQVEAQRRLGQEISLMRAFSAGTGIFWQMVHHVRRMNDRGLATAILTNNIKDFGEYWRQSIPIDEFDVVVDSSHAGVRKPDPEIYLLTAERLGVAPEACVFADDLDANVDAACAVGMTGVLVTDDRSVAIAEIESLVA